MIDFDVTKFFEKISSAIKWQISVALAGILGIASVYCGLNLLFVILSFITSFAISMLILSLIEKTSDWHTNRNKTQRNTMLYKLGRSGAHQFHYKMQEPWPDHDFAGIGWIIAVDQLRREAYLLEHVCTTCKCDLIPKTNNRADGYLLICMKCNASIDIDDIAKRRAINNAIFQGDVRANPRKYFSHF